MLEIVVIIAILPIVPQLAWMILTLLGLLTKRQYSRHVSRPVKFAVIVWAQDQEKHISKCIRSIKNLDYAEEYYETVVVADNCCDRTSEKAVKHGVKVWERKNPDKDSKSYAIEEALRDLLEYTDAEAFVIVDGHSKVESSLLLHLAADIVDGKNWIQGFYFTKVSNSVWRNRFRLWRDGIVNGAYREGLQGLV